MEHQARTIPLTGRQELRHGHVHREPIGGVHFRGIALPQPFDSPALSGGLAHGLRPSSLDDLGESNVLSEGAKRPSRRTLHSTRPPRSYPTATTNLGVIISSAERSGKKTVHSRNRNEFIRSAIGSYAKGRRDAINPQTYPRAIGRNRKLAK